MSVKINEEDRERLNNVQNCCKRKVYSFTDTLNYSTNLQKKMLSEFDTSIEDIRCDIVRLENQNKAQYFLNLMFSALLLVTSIIITIMAFK